MTQVTKSVLLRFVRSFVAGAVATMITVAPMSTMGWENLSTWLSALGLGAIVGGISGLLQASDKYFRTVE